MLIALRAIAPSTSSCARTTVPHTQKSQSFMPSPERVPNHAAQLKGTRMSTSSHPAKCGCWCVDGKGPRPTASLPHQSKSSCGQDASIQRRIPMLTTTHAQAVQGAGPCCQHGTRFIQLNMLYLCLSSTPSACHTPSDVASRHATGTLAHTVPPLGIRKVRCEYRSPAHGAPHLASKASVAREDAPSWGDTQALATTKPCSQSQPAVCCSRSKMWGAVCDAAKKEVLQPQYELTAHPLLLLPVDTTQHTTQTHNTNTPQ